MVIDNFEVVEKKLLKFHISKFQNRAFYTVNIVNNISKEVFRKFFVYNRFHLEKLKHDIIESCRCLNATAYINLHINDNEFINLRLMSKIANDVAHNSRHGYCTTNPYDLVDKVIEELNEKATSFNDRVIIRFDKSLNVDMKSVVESVNQCPVEWRKKTGCRTEFENPSMNYIKQCDDKDNVVYDNAISVIEDDEYDSLVCYALNDYHPILKQFSQKDDYSDVYVHDVNEIVLYKILSL